MYIECMIDVDISHCGGYKIPVIGNMDREGGLATGAFPEGIAQSPLAAPLGLLLVAEQMLMNCVSGGNDRPLTTSEMRQGFEYLMMTLTSGLDLA